MATGSRPVLDWVAFQYVTGELGVEQTEEFERRLDGDQAAREAVARVVELKLAVRSLPPMKPSANRPPNPDPSLRRHSRWYWAAGIAACLLFSAGLPWAVSRFRVDRPKTPIALVWSGLRQTAENATAPSDEVRSIRDNPAGPDLASDSANDGPVSEAPVPEWLLEAVSLGTASPEHRFEPQEN